MLDVIGAVSLAAIIGLHIHVLGNAAVASPAARIALSLAIGAWTGLAAATAAAGLFADTSLPFPWIGLFVAFPVVLVAAACATSPSVRATLLAIPMSTLIGLNIARSLGIFFLLLAWSGRLGGPFPQSAGWGDIITGVSALRVMTVAAQGDAQSDRTIWRWNAFGALDLFAALAFAVLSTNGAPLQLIHAGAGSGAVQLLPWALIPSVLVPLYLITHGIVLAQLRARRIGAPAAARAFSGAA